MGRGVRSVAFVALLVLVTTLPSEAIGRRRNKPTATGDARSASPSDISKPPPDAGFVDTLASLPSGNPLVPDVVATGLGFNAVFPPDTVGEVGPTHFVQMTNGRRGSNVAIFAKNGSAVSRFRLSSLAPKGHPCKRGLTDPVPIFDQFAQRWLLTEIPFPTSRKSLGLCVYVSSGVDPAASTYSVTFIPTPQFPDFHKWGVWPDAYFVGTNEVVQRKQSPVVYAIDRAALLEGRPVTVIRRTLPRLTGFDFNSIQPVDLDGSATPPDGAPGIFIRHRDDESHDPATPGGDSLELFEFTPNFADPDASSVAEVRVGVAEFSSDLCGLKSLKCIAQPATKTRLDPLREPVMHRALLRTFTDHQSLVGTFTTDIDGADTAGTRWFELRRAADGTVGRWSLFQEGTVGAPGASRFMGSIAINGAGDIALGYSVSGPATFPSIAVTGRRTGDDPGRMTQGEAIVVAGTHSQKDSTRWGDYSAMSVDPSDDLTFWYTNEISGPGSAWATKFTSFRFG